MRVVVLAVVVFLFVGFTAVDAGRWSKWYDLTICPAKPCGCKGYNHKCDNGENVMLRSCIYDEDDTTVCQYEGGFGSIKLNTCINKDVCPGWSDWMPMTKCNCDKKTQGFMRLCNRPKPFHPDVLCWDGNTNEGAKVLKEGRDCNCTEEEEKEWKMTTTTTIKTTTTTTAEPTTPLPCCKQENDYEYNYDYDLDNLDQTTTTTSKPEPTKKLSQLDQDYYDYYDDLVKQLPPTADCRSCESDED